MLLAVVVPASPAVVHLVQTGRAFAPENHADWLGDRFLIVDAAAVRAADESSDLASLLATLSSASEASTTSVEAELAVALGGLGFHGAWRSSGRGSVGDLRVPFVAIVDEDAARTPVLVVRVIANYVHAIDPRVGGVLYRPADWTRAWSGLAFVFDERPPSPRAWR